MEENASVYQVNPVSRTTGEGREGSEGRGSLVLIKLERGWGGGADEAAQFVRGNYKSFKGINLTVSERMHIFIMGGGGGRDIHVKLATLPHSIAVLHRFSPVVQL